MTSAPKSDKITAALGAAMKLAKSTTFRPEKMFSFDIAISLVSVKDCPRSEQRSILSCTHRP
jgi:hypothetical protein